MVLLVVLWCCVFVLADGKAPDHLINSLAADLIKDVNLSTQPLLENPQNSDSKPLTIVYSIKGTLEKYQAQLEKLIQQKDFDEARFRKKLVVTLHNNVSFRELHKELFKDDELVDIIWQASLLLAWSHVFGGKSDPSNTASGGWKRKTYNGNHTDEVQNELISIIIDKVIAKELPNVLKSINSSSNTETNLDEGNSTSAIFQALEDTNPQFKEIIGHRNITKPVLKELLVKLIPKLSQLSKLNETLSTSDKNEVGVRGLFNFLKHLLKTVKDIVVRIFDRNPSPSPDGGLVEIVTEENKPEPTENFSKIDLKKYLLKLLSQSPEFVKLKEQLSRRANNSIAVKGLFDLFDDIFNGMKDSISDIFGPSLNPTELPPGQGGLIEIESEKNKNSLNSNISANNFKPKLVKLFSETSAFAKLKEQFSGTGDNTNTVAVKGLLDFLGDVYKGLKDTIVEIFGGGPTTIATELPPGPEGLVEIITEKN